MENKEFDEIFEKIARSHTSIPSEILLSILGEIVKNSDKKSPDVITFAKVVEGCDTADIVSKTVLFTCNSVVLNIWNMFAQQIEKAYSITNGKATDDANSDPGGKA